MKYSEIKFVPMAPIKVLLNPGMEAPGMHDLASLICQSKTERAVNEMLADGWEVIQFITHHSVVKDATAVIAVLGKPWGHNDTSIDTLDLTPRAANCLKGENIFTIGQLICRTEVDLLKMQYLGKKSVAGIKEALAKQGLALRTPS